jgi:hypothetical protein
MELIMTGGADGRRRWLYNSFWRSSQASTLPRDQRTFDQGTGPTEGGMIALSRAFMGQFM